MEEKMTCKMCSRCEMCSRFDQWVWQRRSRLGYFGESDCSLSAKSYLGAGIFGRLSLSQAPKRVYVVLLWHMPLRDGCRDWEKADIGLKRSVRDLACASICERNSSHQQHEAVKLYPSTKNTTVCSRIDPVGLTEPTNQASAKRVVSKLNCDIRERDAWARGWRKGEQKDRQVPAKRTHDIRQHTATRRRQRHWSTRTQSRDQLKYALIRTATRHLLPPKNPKLRTSAEAKSETQPRP